MGPYHNTLKQQLKHRTELVMDVTRVLPGQFCYVYDGPEARIVAACGLSEVLGYPDARIFSRAVKRIHHPEDDGTILARLSGMAANAMQAARDPHYCFGLTLNTVQHIRKRGGGHVTVLRRTMVSELDGVAERISRTLSVCVDIGTIAFGNVFGAAAPHPVPSGPYHGEYHPSPREMEVVRELMKGRTSKQIAGALTISLHTVNAHRRNLLLRTGLSNSAELVRHATEQGWV